MYGWMENGGHETGLIYTIKVIGLHLEVLVPTEQVHGIKTGEVGIGKEGVGNKTVILASNIPLRVQIIESKTCYYCSEKLNQ